MTVRALLFAVILLACDMALAASEPEQGRPTPSGRPMIFYVVKGAPDSCGHGCDRWIAAEGRIDRTTAASFRTFLNGMSDPIPPIYLASPGGDVNQAILMGSALHVRLTIARVGRTVVRECGAEPQDSDLCIKLKQVGSGLHGELVTRGAICASACPYVFVGAAVHEVAPDALLGVHSAQRVLNRTDPNDPALLAADRRAQFFGDNQIAQYLNSVGIEAGLLGLAKTVRFEDMHFLTREEIARFGLDRRDFVETPWIFESRGRGIIHKTAVMRGRDEASYRTLQWQVVCSDADRLVLDFQRPAPSASGSSSVAISGGGGASLSFDEPPAKAGFREQWALRMSHDAIELLLDSPHVELTETSLTVDGQRLQNTIRLSNDSFAFAMQGLMASCTGTKNPAVPQPAAPSTDL